MIFHEPDKTLKRLNGCLKRAAKHAKQGVVSKDHPLYVAYSNFLWFSDDYKTPSEYRRLSRVEREEESLKYEKDELIATMIAIDWFALKVDEYAKEHKVDGDESLSAMLYEWAKRMPFAKPIN